MARVYLRINTALGMERPVRDALRKLGGVKAADIVTRRDDVMAMIEAPNLESALLIVTGQVRKISGMTRTETDLVVE